MRKKHDGNPYDGISGPTPETMSAVLDLLDTQDPAKRAAHARLLTAAVCSFEMGRAFAQAYASDHTAIDQLRRLSDVLDSAIREMSEVRPDIQMMLQNLEEPRYSGADWKGLLDGLAKLRTVVIRSKSAKLPRKRPDAQFEQAIAVLMLRIRDATGKLAHARPADSRYSRPARLSSPEAEAIWLLLRHIDGVTESMVANRIIALRRRYKGDSLAAAFSHYIFIGGAIRPIPAPEGR